MDVTVRDVTVRDTLLMEAAESGVSGVYLTMVGQILLPRYYWANAVQESGMMF